jgi:anti-sigma B factor antagonist
MIWGKARLMLFWVRRLIDMQDLHIKRQRVSGVEVVEMTGAVDALAFTKLSTTLAHLVEETAPCIVLECSRVTYIGSAQLKELIGFAHTAQSRGGDLKCVGLPQTIRQVAKLVAMGNLMEFHDFLPQAMQAFHGSPAAAAV